MEFITSLFETFVGKSIYFDTNPIIYFVEKHEVFFDAISPIFEMIDEDKVIACSSEFTLTEILIKPFRENLQESYTPTKNSY